MTSEHVAPFGGINAIDPRYVSTGADGQFSCGQAWPDDALSVPSAKLHLLRFVVDLSCNSPYDRQVESLEQNRNELLNTIDQTKTLDFWTCV